MSQILFTLRHGEYIIKVLTDNIISQLTFVSLSADLRRTFVSYWRKYVNLLLVNRVGGLSLPKNSMVKLTGVLT